MYQATFDSQKFRELMLYIPDQSRDDRWFGTVKLNKLLYFCDFMAFSHQQAPMTGATYMKLPEGPAPKELLSERQALIDEGLAILEGQRVFRYIQQRLVPVKTGHVLGPSFNDRERKVVEMVIEELRPMNVIEVTDLSHREMGWILTGAGKAIAYEAALLINPDNIEHWIIAESERADSERIPVGT